MRRFGAVLINHYRNAKYVADIVFAKYLFKKPRRLYLTYRFNNDGSVEGVIKTSPYRGSYEYSSRLYFSRKVNVRMIIRKDLVYKIGYPLRLLYYADINDDGKSKIVGSFRGFLQKFEYLHAVSLRRYARSRAIRFIFSRLCRCS